MYGGNFASSQFGREGEGLKWTGQDMTHQNYGIIYILNFSYIGGR